MRRRTMAALLMGSLTAAASGDLAAQKPDELHISARKFVFQPDRITVRVGQPLVLVLTSEDRIHGFRMPDLGLRAEIVPGRETRVALTPGKAGSFTFFCDVFCGGGHEEMEGTLIVAA